MHHFNLLYLLSIVKQILFQVAKTSLIPADFKINIIFL